MVYTASKAFYTVSETLEDISERVTRAIRDGETGADALADIAKILRAGGYENPDARPKEYRPLTDDEAADYLAGRRVFEGARETEHGVEIARGSGRGRGDDMIVLHLSAPNDSNGNPRRLFLILDNDGSPIAAIDEGYAGPGVYSREYPDAPRPQVRIAVTPAEYRGWIKWGKLEREAADYYGGGVDTVA